jgi:hypothetical protein
VQPYHPSPSDHWRWTHTGLELLFTRNASWSALTVVPGSGTAVCLAGLLTCYIDLVAKRFRVRPLGLPLIALVNRTAAAIDALDPQLRSMVPGTLSANYHVVADA